MAIEVPREQIAQAVKALQAYIKSKKDAKKLIDDVEEFSVIFTLKKIMPKNAKTNVPLSVQIPHTYYGREGFRVCLITKLPEKEYEAIIPKMKGLENVKGIYSRDTLRRDYTPYQHRRELLKNYDLFIADPAVLNLPQLLGCKFYAAKKNPVIRVLRNNMKKNVIQAINCVYLHLSTGINCSVKAGNEDFTAEELIANIEAIIPRSIELISKYGGSVRGIHIKTSTSASLPVYKDNYRPEDFEAPELTEKKVKREAEIDAELYAEFKSEFDDLSETTVRKAKKSRN